jgi:molybdenum cofactor cytidylyltransferase
MICAIVLAAGRSERMGTQKVLLPWRGQPLISRVVDELLRSPLGQIIVVVGRDAELIQQALAGRAVTFVANPDPVGDMLSSVRCGLRALPATCEAVLVALGDQPGVTSKLVGELIRAFREPTPDVEMRGKQIVVPVHAGRRGHPLLFTARFRDEILTRYDEVGLHGLLTAHPDEVLEVEVSTATELEDMDTPEDYQRQLKGSLGCCGRA